MSFNEKLQRLIDERAVISSGGPSVSKERLELLFDSGSFIETGAFVKQRPTEYAFAESAGYEPVITGWGTIEGAPVYAFSQDASTMSGAVSEMHAKKICNILDLAAKTGSPVVGFIDTKGAKLAEGIDALNGYAAIIAGLSRISGVVPTIAVVNGPCGGAGAVMVECFDFVIMDKAAELYINSPQIISAVSGKTAECAKAENNAKCGSAQFVAESDAASAGIARAIIAYLPQNNAGDRVFVQSADDLNRQLAIEGFIPDNNYDSVDMYGIVRELADKGEYLEVSSVFGTGMLCAFARLDGDTAGIIANRSDIDIDGANKAARFISLCDSLDIPIITLVDAGGFPFCANFENNGGVKAVARLSMAYAQATVPKISVVVRKAYGSAYVAMCSKGLGADVAFALPCAEISVMPLESAVNIIFSDEIAMSDNPITEREVICEKYRDILTSPYEAAKRGYIDDIIIPAELRQRVIYAAELLSVKRDDSLPKKHSSLPL